MGERVYVADWQHHSLIELLSILSGLSEYDGPSQLAARLDQIAYELRHHFHEEPGSYLAPPPDELP